MTDGRPSFLAVSRQVTGALWGGLTDAKTPLGHKAMVVRGFLSSGLRFATGTVIGRLGPRPVQRLTLWDFERCSASRSVREALSTLDLDADVRPCPRGGTRFRPELESGKVPQLRDPNAQVTLVGSQTIVRHLYARYGAGPAPRLLIAEPVRIVTGVSIRLLSGDRGIHVRPSKAPAQPLELYSFESSPYCRLVRSRLCELELPYTLHNVAKGSPRRPELVARAGRMQVPWLHDPNTGTSLFECLAIEQYLQATYGT